MSVADILHARFCGTVFDDSYWKYLFTKTKNIMKKYKCTVCGWVYDPAIGDPDNGIEPGTAFEDLPDDFLCPLCGEGKEVFEVVD